MPRKSRESEIKQVAARLFASKGYRQTSMEDIASELGMLKGSLYNYVKSKQELAITILADFSKELIKDIKEIAESDSTAAEKLRRLFRQHGKYLLKHSYISMVFLGDRLDEFTSSKNEDLGKSLDEYHRQWRRIVSDGIESGEFRRDLDVPLTVSSLQGICNWMISCKHLRSKLPDSKIADAFADISLKGLLDI